jgi:hypothetical protein
MSSPTPTPRRATFAELYCAKRNLPLTAFPESMFRASLHLPAAVFYRLIVLLSPDFFAADHDLIASVGQLTRAGDLVLDLEEYRYHPGNQSRLRRFFLLCVSTERVNQLVRAHLRSPRPAAPDLPSAGPE